MAAVGDTPTRVTFASAAPATEPIDNAAYLSAFPEVELRAFVLLRGEHPDALEGSHPHKRIQVWRIHRVTLRASLAIWSVDPAIVCARFEAGPRAAVGSPIGILQMKRTARALLSGPGVPIARK
jgi:hypothetical protein